MSINPPTEGLDEVRDIAPRKGGSRSHHCESKQCGTKSSGLSPSEGSSVSPRSPPNSLYPLWDKLGSKRSHSAPSQEPLAQNLGAWRALNPPHFVMESIQGHYLNFKSRPPLVQANPSLETLAQGPSAESISDAVGELLEKGAIEPAPPNPGFYSRLFTVPKKDGSRRPVINLKPLNTFISVPSFKMASVSTVARMIHEYDWAISIDLKDAFFHVPIHQRHMGSFGRENPISLSPAPSA